MKNLEYKGYTGSIEYSKEDELLYGKVLGIRGLISFEGATGPELEEDFKVAIDEYLEMCEAQKIKAEKPFKGSFNVRIPSDLHKEAALIAMELNTSLNGFVSESIRGRVISIKQSTTTSQRVHPVQTKVARGPKRTSKRATKKSQLKH